MLVRLESRRPERTETCRLKISPNLFSGTCPNNLSSNKRFLSTNRKFDFQLFFDDEDRFEKREYNKRRQKQKRHLARDQIKVINIIIDSFMCFPNDATGEGATHTFFRDGVKSPKRAFNEISCGNQSDHATYVFEYLSFSVWKRRKFGDVPSTKRT